MWGMFFVRWKSSGIPSRQIREKIPLRVCTDPVTNTEYNYT